MSKHRHSLWECNKYEKKKKIEIKRLKIGYNCVLSVHIYSCRQKFPEQKSHEESQTPLQQPRRILLETERCILDFCVTYVSKQAELDLVHGSGNKAGAKEIKNTK